MKFKKIKVETHTSPKIGEFIDFLNNTYEVIGYTDAGVSLLVRKVGGSEIFKLVELS